MDEDGQFTYTKPEPKEEQPAEGEDMVENDPLAGSNLDQRDLDEQARQFAQGGGKPQENPPATRNKPSMSVGPDKRLQGLPQDAGNQNVDRRSERRLVNMTWETLLKVKEEKASNRMAGGKIIPELEERKQIK